MISKLMLGFKNTLFIKPTFTMNALQSIYPQCSITIMREENDNFVIRMINKIKDTTTYVKFYHENSVGINGARKIIDVKEVEN